MITSAPTRPDRRRVRGRSPRVPGPFLLLLSLLGLLAAGPGSAAAQIVEGRVAGADGRVLVSLIDADGRVRIQRVTDVLGVFQMPVPSPGEWRVRAERVGVESTTSEAVEIAAGDRTEVTVRAPTEPVDLRELPGDDATRCLPLSDADAAPRLRATWAEVQKALRLVDWTENGGEVLLDAAVHRRELEQDGRTVVRAEDPSIREGVRRVTPPVDAGDLVSRGFIREDEEGGYRYYGVTPEVLLTPAFIETHCLRLLDEGALAGIAFEPVPAAGGEARPDVAGVVWAESRTGRLLMLEFGYRNVDPAVVPAGASGETTFTELPDGSWVIPESWLRMPLVELFPDPTTGEDRWEVYGLLEDRVRLLRARSGDDAWDVTPASGSVRGVVQSVSGDPVEGAMVSLVGTPHQAATDAAGRFAFDGLLEGTWRVGVEHPRFDALPLGPEIQPVSVRPGEISTAVLTPPTPEEAARRLCTGREGLGEGVIVTGQVVDSISGEPLVGVPVTVRFSDPRRAGTPWHEARVTTGAGGFYLYCDAPATRTVRLRAQVPGADHQDDVEVRAANGVARKDLRVRFSTEAATSGVFGMIRDVSTGRPIEQARVTIHESGVQGLTNRNGFFAFADVDPGLYLIEVDHLAYRAREVVARVEAGTALQLNVDLATDAIPIEGITVSVLPRRLFSDMVDLQHRMELGFGEFLVRSDLEIRGGTLGSALQGAAGLRMVTGASRAGERFAVLRNARDLNFSVSSAETTQETAGTSAIEGEVSFEYCYPSVWVDGRRFSKPKSGGIGHDPVDFSQFVTDDIEAVEIYRGSGGVPGEFGGGNSACGAIVLWTRRGGRTIRGEMNPGRAGGDGGAVEREPIVGGRP